MTVGLWSPGWWKLTCAVLSAGRRYLLEIERRGAFGRTMTSVELVFGLVAGRETIVCAMSTGPAARLSGMSSGVIWGLFGATPRGMFLPTPRNSPACCGGARYRDIRDRAAQFVSRYRTPQN